MLTHFRKMAPICIVNILIPFPVLPQPLPPKINVEFWTLKSFFYFRQHFGLSSLFFTSDNILDSQVFFLLQTTLIRGVGGFTAFKRNEIINELNVC